jgi:acetolactate synthase regulatory subunit
MTYIIDMIINEQESTLTRIIQTIRKLQFRIELFHLEKEADGNKSAVTAEITGNRSLELLSKSLKKLEGVHEVCNTTL